MDNKEIFEINLNSEANIIKKIEPFFYKIKDNLKVKDDIFYNMLVAITEGLNNAIMHGNKSQSEKKIYFKATLENDIITVLIKDEGKGFNPELVADPREPENLMKSHGRGVFLIKHLASSYKYTFNSDGTTLEMIFKIK